MLCPAMISKDSPRELSSVPEQRRLRPQGKFIPNPKLALREQVREVMRFFHYSERTENTYWQWIVRYLRFHRRAATPRPSPGLRPPSPAPAGEGRWRHPREMGAGQVAAYLGHLAAVEQVAAATQNQALNALVFLYA